MYKLRQAQLQVSVQSAPNAIVPQPIRSRLSRQLPRSRRCRYPQTAPGGKRRQSRVSVTCAIGRSAWLIHRQTYGEASPGCTTPSASPVDISCTDTDGDAVGTTPGGTLLDIATVPANSEQAMVRFELRTEFTSSVLSTFAHTHGYVCEPSIHVPAHAAGTCSR